MSADEIEITTVRFQLYLLKTIFNFNIIKQKNKKVVKILKVFLGKLSWGGEE